MCHQIDSCAAKSEKLQLLLSQIGFFSPSWRVRHLLCFQLLFFFLGKGGVGGLLTKCVYFPVLYWRDIGD